MSDDRPPPPPPASEPGSPPPAAGRDRALFDAARARIAREAARGPDPGTRTRIVGAWMLGIALLEAGQCLVRILVSFVPKNLHFRDAPFVATAAYAAAALVGYAAWRGLRRGASWARAIVPVFVLGSIAGTYLGLNTVTVRPGPGTIPELNSLTEAWRGVGWPGMLTHLGDFQTSPSGLWHLSDVAAAGFTLVVGLTVVWLLVTGALTPEASRRAAPTKVERAAGFLTAIHLALHAFLTITAIVGLSWRIAGHTL